MNNTGRASTASGFFVDGRVRPLREAPEMTCAMAVLLAGCAVLMLQGWRRTDARRRRARDEWRGDDR